MVAEKYLPSYKITYSKIDGNPLKGITLYDIDFDKKYLAKTLSIRINPLKLSAGIFSISKLHFIDVDVESLERMIDTFSSKDENSSKSSEPLPLALELKDIKFTLLPFDRFGIGFEEISLGIESIEIDSEGGDIGRISQIAKSSIGGIYLIGSFKGGVVRWINCIFLV